VEAQITGQLEHPGIVPIHELATNEQGQPFYIMKFVHGKTLQKVIKEYHKAQMPPGAREVEQLRLLNILVSLCQTVAYAHSRGVLPGPARTLSNFGNLGCLRFRQFV
jgi:eukaryotic-like serine/threonine-protein kinase